MFLTSLRDKFTLLKQHSELMFLLVSGRHVGTHKDGLQYGFSIQMSKNWVKHFSVHLP